VKRTADDISDVGYFSAVSFTDFVSKFLLPSDNRRAIVGRPLYADGAENAFFLQSSEPSTGQFFSSFFGELFA